MDRTKYTIDSFTTVHGLKQDVWVRALVDVYDLSDAHQRYRILKDALHCSKEAKLELLKLMLDQEIIKVIAKTDEDSEVRIAAVRLLEDQGLIENIAKTDIDENVQVEAMIKIKNLVAVKEIGESSDKLLVKRVANLLLKENNE